MVRGTDPARYPAPLKIGGSTELLFHLPSPGFRRLVPGALLFFDAGYYRFFDDESFGSGGGLLLSTGGGLFIDMFGMFELVFTMDYFLNGENIDGTRFTPLDFSMGLNI